MGRLKIGTAVCRVSGRDPITVAKEVASLDQDLPRAVPLRGRWRLEPRGDGNHGTDPCRRWRLLRERVLATKAVWVNEEAEYHGESVSFDPIWQWRKPVEKLRPPIWIADEGSPAHTGASS